MQEFGYAVHAHSDANTLAHLEIHQPRDSEVLPLGSNSRQHTTLGYRCQGKQQAVVLLVVPPGG